MKNKTFKNNSFKELSIKTHEEAGQERAIYIYAGNQNEMASTEAEGEDKFNNLMVSI